MGVSDLLDNITTSEIVDYVDKDDFMKNLSGDDLRDILIDYYDTADYIEAYFQNFSPHDLLEHVSDEDIIARAREIRIDEITE